MPMVRRISRNSDKVWIERICSQNARGSGERFSVDEPCKTVTTVGLGGAGAGGGDWYWVREAQRGEGDDVPKIVKRETDGEISGKPQYGVPLMSEIAAIPLTGLTVASTFSGCGGSSLGYRMAGFKVVWANEFIEAARNCYSANFLDTVICPDDIREVIPEQIMVDTELLEGEIDLLDGSPPCASFSSAGKREAGWGQVKQYSDAKQRTDDLFFEFARILMGLQPKTFVAENVSGLVKGAAKGYFIEILAALKDCGYRVKVKVLDARWLGVPQCRQRCIFVGVRNDLATPDGQLIEPAHPKPLTFGYSVREAIPWIDVRAPMATVQAGAGKRTSSSFRDGHGTCMVPNSGRVGHDRIAENESRSADQPAPTVRADRVHLHTERLMDVESEADMSGYAAGAAFDKMGGAGQSEDYFQLVRPRIDQPCPTVTQTGGNPGAASVCHPTERRKFSIAELRRICAFPDDFVLTGSYAKQWERLGRAVPPVMMFWIARTVRDEILLASEGREPWAGDPQFAADCIACCEARRESASRESGAAP